MGSLQRFGRDRRSRLALTSRRYSHGPAQCVEAARPNERSDQLSAQKHIVGRNGAKNVGVHDVDQPLRALMDVPADEHVTYREIKNRIANGDEPHELVVVLVPYEIPQSAAKAVRHRHRPGERGKPKQVALPGIAPDALQCRRHASRIDLASRSGSGRPPSRIRRRQGCRPALSGSRQERDAVANAS